MACNMMQLQETGICIKMEELILDIPGSQIMKMAGGM